MKNFVKLAELLEHGLTQSDAENLVNLINTASDSKDAETLWQTLATHLSNYPFAINLFLFKNVSVFFNIACDTGEFEAPKRNMAENLIFLSNQGASPRGAIDVLAASAPSYTNINDRFDIHLFEFMEKEKSLPLGHLVALANDKLVLEDGGQMNDNTMMYVLLGDPLLSIW